MSKLKLCPFCGKYPQTVVDDETEEKFGVKCFACGGAIYPEKNTLDEAIEAWNRRVKDDNSNLDHSNLRGNPHGTERCADHHATARHKKPGQCVFGVREEPKAD